MKLWTWIVGGVALVAVGGAAGFGVATQQELGRIEHAPAYQLPQAEPVLVPAVPRPVDVQALQARLAQLAEDPALGTFHARVSDGSTGEVLFDRLAGEALRPASTTKILTAAAAVLELGADDRIETRVVSGEQPGSVVIKANGDVWLDAEAVNQLADQLKNQQVTAVFIDTGAWEGQPTMMPGWDPVDIDGGFVAPLEPAMLSGGRLNGETEGDVPRSHTPALDVAQALADRVGAQTVGIGPAPAEAETLASVESPDLVQRLHMMMKESDNVYAEAIGREVAAHVGIDAPSATLHVLAEHGFDTGGITLVDSSGLSVDNRITPRLLDSILSDATQHEQLRPMLDALPIAAGDGTLATRYGDLAGRGWVRAKTGTLDETSGLAGTVTAESGNVYTFALLSNDSDILEARRAMDTFASALREF